MAQILVRNIDDAAFERLKKRAKANGHSVTAEIKIILDDAIKYETDATEVDKETALEIIDRARQRLKGLKLSDSAELIREDRDR
jgi:plasmid stability protein